MKDIILYGDTTAGTQGYTAYDSIREQIIVVFRGSVNLLNHIEDFWFFRLDFDKCSDCKIHHGF